MRNFLSLTHFHICMTTKVRLLRGGALTLALATSLMGCNREKMAQELPQPSQTAAQAQANQQLAAVAKALARTLSTDAAARQALKAEALKKFDGDYDVLYQPFAAGHAAFGQHVAEAVASTGPAGLTMPALLGRIPMLNISVPVNIEKWDAATYAPLVIFIPAGYNERTATRVLAYDQDGNEHWLDAKKAPGFPVVVVGPSERVRDVVASARTTPTAALQPQGAPTSSVIDEPEVTPDPDTPPDGSSGGTPANITNGTYNPTFLSGPNCRVDKRTEYLRSMWLADVGEFESWFLSDPEICLRIKSPKFSSSSSGNLVETMYTMGRKTIGETYNCNTGMYFWDKTSYSDAVGYLWYEQDDTGDPITVTLSVGYKNDNGLSASADVKFTIKNDDDQIALAPMNFEQCPSEGYFTGATSGKREFRWSIENR